MSVAIRVREVWKQRTGPGLLHGMHHICGHQACVVKSDRVAIIVREVWKHCTGSELLHRTHVMRHHICTAVVRVRVRVHYTGF